MDYVTKEELAMVYASIAKRLEKIETNDLPHLFTLVLNVYDKVKDLKWFIAIGFTVMGIVIALAQLLD